MNAVHDGVVPWWLEPQWWPQLPAPWDIASEFREALRYSLAGAYQGALLVVGSLVFAVLGVPVRGILLLSFALGLLLWVVSVAFLVPRPRRPLLRDYARRFPGLWEWFRPAIAREDRRAARGVLLLHGIVAVLLLPMGWILWSELIAQVFVLVAAGTASALTLLQLVILKASLNSAGLRIAPVRLSQALRE